MNSSNALKQNKKLCTVVAVSSLLLLLSFMAALFFGSTKLTATQVIGGLLGSELQEITVIVQKLRLPRALAAVVAGVGLSVAGVLLQSVTDNDLASPNIIGINSGAGFAVIVMLAVFPYNAFAIPFAAFLGAFAAAMLIVYTSSKIGVSKSTVVLAGVALTTILNAAISFISMVDTDTMATYSHFSVGGLAGVTLKDIALPAVLVAVSVVVVFVLADRISILCLGDSLAAS